MTAHYLTHTHTVLHMLVLLIPTVSLPSSFLIGSGLGSLQRKVKQASERDFRYQVSLKHVNFTLHIALLECSFVTETNLLLQNQLHYRYDTAERVTNDPSLHFISQKYFK